MREREEEQKGDTRDTIIPLHVHGECSRYYYFFCLQEKQTTTTTTVNAS